MRLHRLPLTALLFAVSSSAVALVEACAGETPTATTPAGVATPAKPGAPRAKRESKGFKKTGDQSYSYVLGIASELQSVFPVAGQPLVPSTYTSNASYPAATDYKDLPTSAAFFTTQSMQRDGIQVTSLSVTFDGPGTATVNVTSPSPQSEIDTFAAYQAVFVSQMFAYQGYLGALACNQTQGCWDPDPSTQYPWALDLPLGLQIVHNRAALLLDYPPAISFACADYLNNATMNRWKQLLYSVRSQFPDSYMTIVDARPIAAPGGSAPNDGGPEGNLLPPPQWFNGDGGKVQYTTPMLNVVDFVQPPTVNPWPVTLGTKPIAILGGAAAEAWTTVVPGPKPKTRQTGTATLVGSGGAVTNWIASSHPIATAYDRCGDTSKNQAYSYDELTDLFGVCTLATLAGESMTSCSDFNLPWGTAYPPPLSADHLQEWCSQMRWDVCNQYGMPQYTMASAYAYCSSGKLPCDDTTCQDGVKPAAPKRASSDPCAGNFTPAQPLPPRR